MSIIFKQKKGQEQVPYSAKIHVKGYRKVVRAVKLKTNAIQRLKFHETFYKQTEFMCFICIDTF